MQSRDLDGSYHNPGEQYAPVSDALKEVKDAQREASEGFLTEQDIDKAIELHEKYSELHSSCTVYVAPTCAEEEMTTLSLNGAAVAERKETMHDYGERATGFYVDFSFTKDEDEELFEKLKAAGFSASSKRKYFDFEAGTNEAPQYAQVGRAEANLSSATYVAQDKSYDQSTIMKRAHELAGAIVEEESYSDALSEAMSRVWSEAKEQMEEARRRTRIDCNYVAAVTNTHEKYDLSRKFLDEHKWGYDLQRHTAYEIDYDGERTYLLDGEEVGYEDVKSYAEEQTIDANERSCWECGHMFTRVEIVHRSGALWDGAVGGHCYCGC